MALKSFFDLKIISLLVSMALILMIMNVVGVGGSLDARFFYLTTEANLFLQSLSPEAISSYRLVEYLDLFFIYKYTRFFQLGFARLCPQVKHTFWLACAPGAFDALETLNILWALHNTPSVILFPGLGYVTAIKWILAGLAVFMILYKLVRSTGETV